MKNFIKLIGILYLIFLSTFLTHANNNNDNNIVKIIGNIEDQEGNKYNYFNIEVRNNTKIICNGISRQHFEYIELDGRQLDIMRVKENGVARFDCNKEDIIDNNGLIKEDVFIRITSDGFYRINDSFIDIEINNKNIINNTIIIGNYNQGNYKLLLDNVGSRYYNIYDSNAEEKINRLKEQELRSELLKAEADNIRNVNIIINNIPNDIGIDKIQYRLDGSNYEYDIKNKNNNSILSSKEQIDLIAFNSGNFFIENSKIINDKIILEFDELMIPNEIGFYINITDIPSIVPIINITFDNNRTEQYNPNKRYILNNTQKENGFKLKIGEREFNNIKLEKNETLNIKFNTLFKDYISPTIIEKEDIEDINKIGEQTIIEGGIVLDNNYLSIKLDKKYLDGLNRLVYFELRNNGGRERKIIEGNDILISNNDFIVIKFLSKNDFMVDQIQIGNEILNIIDISLNYKEFIK